MNTLYQIWHYKAKDKIVSSLSYLVLIQTGYRICACVKLYHVITLNTCTLIVIMTKRKFDSKLKKKESIKQYSAQQSVCQMIALGLTYDLQSPCFLSTLAYFFPLSPAKFFSLGLPSIVYEGCRIQKRCLVLRITMIIFVNLYSKIPISISLPSTSSLIHFSKISLCQIRASVLTGYQ